MRLIDAKVPLVGFDIDPVRCGDAQRHRRHGRRRRCANSPRVLERSSSRSITANRSRRCSAKSMRRGRRPAGRDLHHDLRTRRNHPDCRACGTRRPSAAGGADIRHQHRSARRHRHGTAGRRRRHPRPGRTDCSIFSARAACTSARSATPAGPNSRSIWCCRTTARRWRRELRSPNGWGWMATPSWRRRGNRPPIRRVMDSKGDKMLTRDFGRSHISRRH